MRLFSVVVLLAGVVAFADVAPEPFSAAGEPKAMDGGAAAKIAMAREEVIITLHDGFAIVDATFEMKNAGAKATINVGFPGEGVIVGGARGYAAHRPLLGFTAWIDSKRVESSAKREEIVMKGGPRGREYTKRRDETWHVFPATFAAKKPTTIRVRYAVLADGYRGESYQWGEESVDATVSYILATGARWSGKIGEAVIRVRTADGVDLGSVRVRDNKQPLIAKRAKTTDEVKKALPSYGKQDQKEIVLVRKQLEPTTDDNLEIVYAATPRRGWGVDQPGETQMSSLAEQAAKVP